MRIFLPAVTVLDIVIAVMILVSGPAVAQDATPATAFTCETVMSTPGGSRGTDQQMPVAQGSPMAGHGQMKESGQMDADQMYIEMMIPHHESIIAMSEAALPRLTEERLREIARAIIDTQKPEVEELHTLRASLFGETGPIVIGPEMMEALAGMMPGMNEDMDDMAFQMDAVAQVTAICAASDPDLTFIDLTIAHHNMAIVSSEPIVNQTERLEVRAFAQRVIDAQQAEINVLTEIRSELTGEATPAG